jgi:phosphoglycerate dehydrogenase-like enzyme
MARRLYLPVEMEGKVLGIIGCGKIGRLVAEKCIKS